MLTLDCALNLRDRAHPPPFVHGSAISATRAINSSQSNDNITANNKIKRQKAPHQLLTFRRRLRTGYRALCPPSTHTKIRS